MLLNRERAYAVMDKHGLDVLVASTEGNVAYTTDYWPLGTFRPMGHQSFCILPRDEKKEPAIVMPISDLAAWVTKKSWVQEIWSYGTYHVEGFEQLHGHEKKFKEVETRLISSRLCYPSSLEALIAALRHKSFAGASIGLDEMNIPVQHIEALKTKLDRAKISYAYEIFREIRMIKTPEEIARIHRSTQVAERAVEDVWSSARVGMTEIQLAGICRSSISRQGGVPALWFVGCGTLSSLTDRDPTDYALRPGDWIMLDVFSSVEHYYSDTARSVVLGDPSPRQVKYYEAILKGRNEALKLIKPGVKASEIYRAAIGAIRDNGIPHFRRHHIGHSTGIEPYDPPLINADTDLPLEENMVVIIETPYYEVGFGAIQLEDTVLVTSDGFRYLSALPQELQVIG